MSLSNKVCTKITVIFLVCSICSILLLMMSRVGEEHGFALFSNYQEISGIFFYYLCCLFSGLSLIFSTGVRSKELKWMIIVGHFGCIYIVGLFWISLMIIQGFIFVLAIMAYLLVSIRLMKTKNQKRVAIVCLGLPMGLSTGFFIKLNYDLLTSGDYWSTLGFVILLSFSGLVGLILAANLDNTNRKAKWFLLGINYVFAVYFHIVLLLL
ncbi:hypothetical protein ACTNBL_05205 [Enterococcus villorum]|nr:hypothetical protein [Enterococcus villorum]EOH92516.1 hypothetical protein UAO_00402 [Enterococcus villorum ATCC 700913]EOW75619.1 hypothetical protein I591_02712 [Enterococcus villorum ATCC 700913]